MVFRLLTSREVSYTSARAKEIAILKGWGTACTLATILAHALDEVGRFESENGPVDWAEIYARDPHEHYGVPDSLDCGIRFATSLSCSEQFAARIDRFTEELARYPFVAVHKVYRNLSVRLLYRFLIDWDAADVPVIGPKGGESDD